MQLPDLRIARATVEAGKHGETESASCVVAARVALTGLDLDVIWSQSMLGEDRLPPQCWCGWTDSTCRWGWLVSIARHGGCTYEEILLILVS